MRRAYPTTLQVQAVAAQAKAVGIDRPGAIAVKPDGTIWIFDASLARRFSVASVQSIIRRYVSGAAVGAALLKRFRRA